MNDWTDGYVSDIEYSANFYRELTPVFLNTCALIHGYVPPDLKEYNYLELGCGRGIGSLLIAAANPEGNFYAVDFNPAHIHEAKRIAREAGLSNIYFIEASFKEAAAGQLDIPEFRYIVFHGIYTWVNSKNRASLRQIIRKYLSSGGLAFNSYNCMPGWAPASPLQRILRDWSRQHQGRSTERLNKAVASLKSFADINPRFMENNPGVKERLDRIAGQDPNYLVHEYLHDSWKVHWSGDVLDKMQKEAKLDFIGQANPVEAYPGFVLPEPAREQIDEISDPGFKEELKDTWLNRQFRKDLYCRGGLKSVGQEQLDMLLDTQVVSVLENMENLDFNFQLPIGKVSPNVDLYRKFLHLVDKTPKRIRQVREELEIKPMHAIQLSMVMISVGWIHPVIAGNGTDAAERLNRVLAKQSYYSSRYSFVASPVTGSAKKISLTDFLILDALHKGYSPDHAGEICRHVWQSLASRNLKLKKEEKTLEHQEENITYLEQEVFPKWLERTAPVWKALGIAGL